MSNSFVTPWTVARHAPLSIGFSRQEYWRGLPFPSPKKGSGVEDFLYVCSGDGMIVENSLFSPQNTCHHLVGSQYSVENYLRNTHAVQFSSCQYWSVIATLWGGHWGSLLPCKGKKTQRYLITTLGLHS